MEVNNSNVTTGAYIGSDFYTGANSNTGRATAQATIKAAGNPNISISRRGFRISHSSMTSWRRVKSSAIVRHP